MPAGHHITSDRAIILLRPSSGFLLFGQSVLGGSQNPRYRRYQWMSKVCRATHENSSTCQLLLEVHCLKLYTKCTHEPIPERKVVGGDGGRALVFEMMAPFWEEASR